MIVGFEEETEELTQYELEVLVPIMVKGLSTKIGSKSAITNKRIREKLSEKDIDVSDPRIRKVINYIRMNLLVKNLIASSKGYYISTDIKEIEEYRQGLISRANAILKLAKTYEI